MLPTVLSDETWLVAGSGPTPNGPYHRRQNDPSSAGGDMSSTFQPHAGGRARPLVTLLDLAVEHLSPVRPGPVQVVEMVLLRQRP
jgi:hypothetical protein